MIDNDIVGWYICKRGHPGKKQYGYAVTDYVAARGDTWQNRIRSTLYTNKRKAERDCNKLREWNNPVDWVVVPRYNPIRTWCCFIDVV